MSDSPLESIKKTQEIFSSSIRWAIQNLRSNSISEKLSLLAAIILVAGNRITVSGVLTVITNWQLPHSYSLYWAITIVLLLVSAFLVAWKSRPVETAEKKLLESKTLKVLTPFDRTDEAIFSKLQRNVEILDCTQAITHPEFRFGILRGDSGNGKTSFLKAGLWPALLKRDYFCSYIKVANEDIVVSIKKALSEYLPSDISPNANLATILQLIAHKTSNKPLVLMLDQFEQFFVQNRRKEGRETFIEQLRQWCELQQHSVKLIICIRTDFYGRLMEILDVIGWPQQNFELERFTPEQATEIFRVIADEMNLEFDYSFVTKMTSEELASTDDGRVSPVDIQILSWMIIAHANQEAQSFTSRSFQLIGGVEGLLERYLSRRLDELGDKSSSRRQNAIKVLLALTDLNRNTRAGSLTIQDLSIKLTDDKISTAEIKESLEWLTRGYVRLVIPTGRDKIESYELAHERLVFAVRKEANKQLSEVEQASLLLGNRVNEWLGNNRHKRYLLSFSELRLIKRQSPFMVWDPDSSAKQSLVRASARRIKRNWLFTGLLLIPLFVVSLITLNEWRRQRLAIKTFEEQVNRSGREVEESREEAITFAATQAFGAVYLHRGDKESPSEIIEGFLRVMDGIGQKKLATSAIVTTASKMSSKDQGIELLSEFLMVAEKSDDEQLHDAINGIVDLFTFENNPRDRKFLNQAQNIAEKIQDNWSKTGALQDIARAYLNIKDEDKALQLLKESEKFATGVSKNNIGKGDLFRDAAFIYSTFGKKEESMASLGMAINLAEEMDDSTFRSAAFSSTSDAYVAVGKNLLDLQIIRQALPIREKANGTSHPWFKSRIKLVEAYIYARLKQKDSAMEALRQSVSLIDTIEDTNPAKANGLIEIASLYIGLGLKGDAEVLLARSLQVVDQVKDLEDRGHIIKNLARLRFESGDKEKCLDLIKRDLQLLDLISDEFKRDYLIRQLVGIAVKLGDFQVVRAAASKQIRKSEEAKTLTTALNKWASSNDVKLEAVHFSATDYLSIEIVK